jgi:hypothetical protein
MKRIPLDDYQLDTETINPIKERCHRIFLALVLTGMLYVQVEHNQAQMTQTVSPFRPSPILITPINKIAFSNISNPSTDTRIKSRESNLCRTDETESLAVTCVNQPNQATLSH